MYQYLYSCMRALYGTCIHRIMLTTDDLNSASVMHVDLAAVITCCSCALFNRKIGLALCYPPRLIILLRLTAEFRTGHKQVKNWCLYKQLLVSNDFVSTLLINVSFLSTLIVH